MRIEVGSTLAGRYRADTLLRRGGMGEVWRCHDMEQQRDVAVKVVRRDFLSEPWAARLFHAEVMAVARLNHPGIIPVYDLVTNAEGAGAFLVMEFRPGVPLSDLVSLAPPWWLIRDVLEQVLLALAYAHARGTLHLDVKPDNVLVERTGAVRATLLDFGIARVRRPGRGIERWVDRDVIMGTLAYMAPEQCTGQLERLGPWTDLYGVGALAFELCSGLTPFAGGDVAKSITRRMSEPAPTLQPRNHDVPADFPSVCAWLLETEPRRRPLSAADVLCALRQTEALPRAVLRDVAVDPSWGAAVRAPTARVPYPLEVADTQPRAAALATPLLRPAAAPLARPSTGPGSYSTDMIAVDDAQPPSGAYGLFGLRDLPVMGRTSERRTLWGAVDATIRAGRPQVVLLEGPAGVGKSRLARDAMERAAELGLAGGMQTSWSADGSGDEGLRGLLENLLDTRGATASQLRARLHFWLERIPGDHKHFAHEVELLLRPPAAAAPDADLPLRVAVDAIRRGGALTPVIVWLDDVQWSRGEALALVNAALGHEPPLPVCLVLTARDEDRTAYDELSAHPSISRIRMDPLDGEAGRQLVRGLLEVDDELCELLAARAEGNPLFATELVRQLVDTDALERRDGRYRLARELDFAAVPADIGAVWERRLASSGAARRELTALAFTRERVSLEVAGWLGGVLGPELEVAVACALAAGLLRVDAGAYVWTHGLLRDHLIATVLPGQAPSLRDACATALAPLVGREDVQEERARHLRAAGHARQACLAMLDAGQWSTRRAESIARRLRFETLASWAESGSLVDLHGRALAELAFLDVETGQAHRADARVSAARAIATSPAAAAWVIFRASQIARLQGRVEDGVRLTAEALTLAREAAMPEVEALTLQQQGLDCVRSKDLSGARRHLDESAAICRRSGDLAGEAQALRILARAVDKDQARSVASRAIALAREAGATRVELFSRHVWVDLLWRDGERVAARQEAASLSEEAARRSQRQTVSMLELQSAVWAVGDDDWPAARSHRDTAARWGAATGAVPERAYLFALDAALAVADGDHGCARAALAGLGGVKASVDDLIRDVLSHAAALAPEALAAELRTI